MGVRDELCGRTVGEFVLRERIGEGAYGAVYRCEQPLLGREAVIKVLHGRFRTKQVMVQRFLREARLASRLDHPYAAHVYAFGVEKEDRLLWIAMEMVHGTPLDRWLAQRGPLPLAQLVPFFERIAEVVQTGHEHGIVHRDLKPSNVMVIERAGRLLPKLLDFGVAKMLSGEEPVGSGQMLLGPIEEPDGAASVVDSVADTAPPALSHGTTLTDTAQVTDPSFMLQSELTDVGTMMGTPSYMAPEQWVGEEVGPRADLYALGVLAYEALTGRRPFHTSSVAELATLHMHAPVPPVGGELPETLDRFFARALAKRPLDRPASALELAAALRVASGLAEDPLELPRLERGIRDIWVAEAPQPLAEAIAALEGARNPHQARDVARDLFRTLVRYLLALVLASRAQVREASDDPVADALLRDLGRRGLDDAERVRLMRRLVQGFAAQRGAHPIPPLVDLLVPRTEAGEGEGEGEGGDTLEPVLRIERAADPRGGDDLVRSQLVQLVGALGRLLRAASFLLDYRLVIARSGACESWMGLRREHRRLVTPRGAAPPERQPVLLDLEGRSTLALWPLAQVAPPTPGAEDELFLFDGPDRRGARLVATPRGFELHDPALWDWLGKHAFAWSAEDARASSEADAPYLGLEPFSAADADLFVGREREVDALSNRLRTAALQIVVGASGAGKSSFVHAGVVPALPPGSRVVAMRPGNRPVATLAAKLGAAGVPEREIRELFNAVSGTSTTLGAAAAFGATDAWLADATDDGLLVLIVDQLEELFTLCHDQAARERFSAILDALTSSSHGRIRVIGTLRDDFLMRAAALPVLGPRVAASVFLLGNPSREDLIRTIVEPARRLGYELSDAELAPEMAQAVAGRPGALALLSFTAARLWELRDRRFLRLTRAAYEAMGGVGGALGQHAEETLAALGAEDRRLVREAFRHLVTAEGTRAQLSVADLGQALASPNAAAVIDKLVAARLLVIAEHEDGARVEIVHEALLAAWPRAQEWIREDADSVRMRDQVRSAARQWDERGRARGLLWRDEPLAELERWRRQHEVHGLTAIERAFADASRAAAARGRRIRRLVLVSGFVALAVALAVMFWLREEARHQRALVQEQLVSSYIERGQQALLVGNTEAARESLEAAYRMGADTPAVRFMRARARESIDAELATLGGHAGQVWYAAFSPDGTRVLTGGQDASVHVWGAASGRELHALRGHVPPVLAAWSPSGEVATADAAGTIRLWTADGRLRASIASTGGRGAASGIAFAGDGAHVAVPGSDGSVVIGDARTGQLRATWKADPEAVYGLAFDPSGTRVVTATASGTAAVWSLEGRELAKLEGHTASIWQAVFDATGERVITVSLDRTARVWDAQSGATIHRLVGHEDRVRSVAVDARGRWIATASADTTVRIWSLPTGELVTTLRGHTAQVNAVVFAPDDQLVSASSDGTARVWDVARGIQTAAFHHGGSLRNVAVEPGTRRVATASWSGTAKIWDLSRQSRLRTYAAPVADTGADGAEYIDSVIEAGRLARIGTQGLAIWELGSARQWAWRAPDIVEGALSPDGKLALAADKQGVLHVLDGTGAVQRPLRVAGERVGCLAAYPDGRRVAICGPGDTVSVWDVATGKKTAERRLGAVNSISVARDGGAVFAYESDRRQEGKSAGWLLADDLSRAIRLDHEGGMSVARFSPDGARLVTLSFDGSARVWSRDGALEATLPHVGPVANVAWSSDGSWLVTGTYAGTLTIWDRSGWRARKAIEAHATLISALAIDGGDALIASAGSDGLVKIWDVASLLQVARIPMGEAVKQLAFDRDRLLASGQSATQAWRCDR
ncbi:MAG TPA: protein kinase [Kofleriaceae bacterium]|nr:protein kinase [Kofleriaceae bacterium]